MDVADTESENLWPGPDAQWSLVPAPSSGNAVNPHYLMPPRKAWLLEHSG